MSPDDCHILCKVEISPHGTSLSVRCTTHKNELSWNGRSVPLWQEIPKQFRSSLSSMALAVLGSLLYSTISRSSSGVITPPSREKLSLEQTMPSPQRPSSPIPSSQSSTMEICHVSRTIPS